MSSSAVNICVFALVLLSIQHTCHSRPQNRNKRGIVKDYFNPLSFSPEEFEKGEDGKFYLKKSAHRSDSAVNYVNVENIDDESSIKNDDLKSAIVEVIKDETKAVLGEKLVNEMMAEIEDSEKANIEVSSSPPYLEDIKISKEIVLPKSETMKAEKIEISKEKAPFTPVDPKFMVPSKPDSKDEIAVKTDISPIEEEKTDEKVTIGQFPHFHSRVIPIPTNFRIPILIPIRKISYGSVSVVPLPPTEVSDRLPLPPAEVSDRLPLPLSGVPDKILPFALDDIVGEGEHESASLEPVAEEKKEAEYPEADPLAIRVQLPFLSFSGLVKDLQDINKEDGEKQSKVVDVLGKKFLMQTNIVKYPSGANSHTFVRFMSVKPLENNEPTMLKKDAVEEGIKSVIKETDRKEMDEIDMKKKKIDMKKEMEEIDSQKKEIEKIDSNVKKIEDIDRQKKEIVNIDLEKKSVEAFDMKKKEIEAEGEIFKAEEKLVDIEKGKEEPLPKAPEILKVEESQISVKVDSLVPKDSKKEIGNSDMGEEKSEDPFVKEMKMKKKIESDILEISLKNAEKKEIEEGKSMVDEKIVTDGESLEGVIEKEMKKEMDVVSTEELFFLENKKKIKTEEGDLKNPKKKNEKKKKKCKCEEEDSDSDDD